MYSIGVTLLDLLTHTRFTSFWSALPVEMLCRYLGLGLWASAPEACARPSLDALLEELQHIRVHNPSTWPGFTALSHLDAHCTLRRLRLEAERQALQAKLIAALAQLQQAGRYPEHIEGAVARIWDHLVAGGCDVQAEVHFIKGYMPSMCEYQRQCMREYLQAAMALAGWVWVAAEKQQAEANRQLQLMARATACSVTEAMLAEEYSAAAPHHHANAFVPLPAVSACKSAGTTAATSSALAAASPVPTTMTAVSAFKSPAATCSVLAAASPVPTASVTTAIFKSVAATSSRPAAASPVPTASATTAIFKSPAATSIRPAAASPVATDSATTASFKSPTATSIRPAAASPVPTASATTAIFKSPAATSSRPAAASPVPTAMAAISAFKSPAATSSALAAASPVPTAMAAVAAFKSAAATSSRPAAAVSMPTSPPSRAPVSSPVVATVLPVSFMKIQVPSAASPMTPVLGQGRLYSMVHEATTITTITISSCTSTYHSAVTSSGAGGCSAGAPSISRSAQRQALVEQHSRALALLVAAPTYAEPAQRAVLHICSQLAAGGGNVQGAVRFIRVHMRGVHVHLQLERMAEYLQAATALAQCLTHAEQLAEGPTAQLPTPPPRTPLHPANTGGWSAAAPATSRTSLYPSLRALSSTGRRQVATPPSSRAVGYLRIRTS